MTNRIRHEDELRVLKSKLEERVIVKDQLTELNDWLNPFIEEIVDEWMKTKFSRYESYNMRNKDIDDFDLLSESLSVEGEYSCFGGWDTWQETIPLDFIFDRENCIERLEVEYEEARQRSVEESKRIVVERDRVEEEQQYEQFLKLYDKFGKRV